jgi:hypothetical protein
MGEAAEIPGLEQVEELRRGVERGLPRGLVQDAGEGRGLPVPLEIACP